MEIKPDIVFVLGTHPVTEESPTDDAFYIKNAVILISALVEISRLVEILILESKSTSNVGISTMVWRDTSDRRHNKHVTGPRHCCAASLSPGRGPVTCSVKGCYQESFKAAIFAARNDRFFD